MPICSWTDVCGHSRLLVHVLVCSCHMCLIMILHWAIVCECSYLFCARPAASTEPTSSLFMTRVSSSPCTSRPLACIRVPLSTSNVRMTSNPDVMVEAAEASCPWASELNPSRTSLAVPFWVVGPFCCLLHSISYGVVKDMAPLDEIVWGSHLGSTRSRTAALLTHTFCLADWRMRRACGHLL